MGCNKGKAVTGLELAYVSKMEGGCGEQVTYGTPIQFPNIQIVSATPNVLTGSSSADNVTNIIEERLSSLVLSLTFQDINDEMLAFLQDRKIDIDTGAIITSSKDIAPSFAFGYKTTYSDGTAKYVWLLNTKFGNFNTLSATTKDDSGITYQEVTCDCTAIPTQGEYNDFYVTLRTDSPGYNEEVGLHWFDEVKVPTLRIDPTQPA